MADTIKNHTVVLHFARNREADMLWIVPSYRYFKLGLVPVIKQTLTGLVPYKLNVAQKTLQVGEGKGRIFFRTQEPENIKGFKLGTLYIDEVTELNQPAIDQLRSICNGTNK